MSNLYVLRAGNRIVPKVFPFPGGELGVKLDLGSTNSLPPATSQTVVARLQSSADIMALMLLVDALRRVDNTPIHLVLPYIPYGRQDRVCVPGESFSLKVMANLINSLGVQSVKTFDPHSDVTGAVIDNLTIVTQVQIVHRWDDLCNRLRAPDVRLVSPDAGANKKTAGLAAYLGHADFVRADKLRDLGTGKIKETVVYADDLSGQTIAIVDDLCDYGNTFILLAKALKAKKAAKVVLYVTQGLMSGGAQMLFDGGLDEVFTTTSYRIDHDARVKAFDIDSLI